MPLKPEQCMWSEQVQGKREGSRFVTPSCYKPRAWICREEAAHIPHHMASASTDLPSRFGRAQHVGFSF